MAQPFSSYGNTQLREFAYDAFTYVALIDNNGNEITRIDVTSDPRLVNTPDPTTNPLSYSFEIQGSDDDITRPVIIAKTELYDTSSATTPIGTDTMVDATIESPGDIVTVTHEQQIPQM